MTLLYKPEHLSCLNYSTEADRIFHVLHLEKGQSYTRRYLHSTFLVFLISGQVTVDYGIGQCLIHRPDTMYLLPKDLPVEYTAPEDSVVLLCTFSTDLKLCSRYSIRQLSAYVPADTPENLYTLPLDRRISSFATQLAETLQEGLGCVHFHQLKRDELLLYLRAGYTKEELACFFYPVLGVNLEFKDFVLAHYQEAADVKQLAVRAHMSLSTFNRRFKETFRETARDWLLARKSEHLLRDIVMTDLPFAELAARYHFSSAAYLTAFCKKNLGGTPYELREKGKENCCTQ